MEAAYRSTVGTLPASDFARSNPYHYPKSIRGRVHKKEVFYLSIDSIGPIDGGPLRLGSTKPIWISKGIVLLGIQFQVVWPTHIRENGHFPRILFTGSRILPSGRK